MSSSGPRLPALSSSQARELDRISAERFGVPVEWLMEAAGWQLARHCRGQVAVICGYGNNGGDGLAAARHLDRWGRLHSVACIDAGRLAGAAAAQAGALVAAGVTIESEPRLTGAQIVLDALLGTGLSREPSGAYARWIEMINASGLRVISVDLPSGVDADSGRTPGVAVRADVTVSLGLPKAGLLEADGPAHAGEVWLADIGLPLAAYAAIGLTLPPHLFSMHDRIQLAGIRP